MSNAKNKDNAGKITKVEIELIDGERHAVACTMGVLIRFQLMTGRNAFKKQDLENMGPMEYVQFLAAAIYKDDPLSKVAELSEKVDGMAVSKVMEIVSAIFQQGEAAEKKEEAPTPAPQTK